MSDSTQNIHPVIEETLKNFFDKAEKKEFLRILIGEAKPESVIKVAKSDDQINFDISSGSQTRYQVDQIITFAESKYHTEKLIEFFIYLGQLTITSGENQIAIEIYERIVNLCDGKRGTADIIANALLSIGEIYSRQAQWEMSVTNLDKAIKIFQEENDIKGSIHCQNIFGTIQGDQGNLERAKEHFENALIALEGIKDIALVGKIEINLAIINNMQSNYNEAISYLKRALLNFEKLGDLKRISEVKHNLGMVYTKKKEYSAAISEFDYSIDASVRSNYLQNIGITYISKAYVYAHLKDFELAEAFSNKAMEIAHKVNDKLSIAEVYKVKGIISRNRRQYELAENSLLTSYRLNKELSNKLNLAETAQELGILYKQKRDSEKSNQFFTEALSYFRKINSVADIQELEKLITN
ncbi:MAG: tetratricopeptide repeat protein [Ignavibacteriaceae bacterium]|nr:tetratricopeptide repeat protein [Ignavibacteriaceae bacterium]